MERAVRPWLKIDFLFDLSPLGRVQSDCVQILHDFTNKVIQVFLEGNFKYFLYLKGILNFSHFPEFFTISMQTSLRSKVA